MPGRRVTNRGDRRNHHRPSRTSSTARNSQPSHRAPDQRSNAPTVQQEPNQVAIHEANSRHEILARFQEILNNHLFEDVALAGSEPGSDEEDASTSSAPSINDLWKRVITVDDQDEDGEAICYICQEDVEVGTAVTYLSAFCQHWFCTECLKPWLEDQGQDSCPVCRENIVAPKK